MRWLNEAFAEAGHRLLGAAFVLMYGWGATQTEPEEAPKPVHEHKPHARGVTHALGNLGGIPTPVTEVLLVCEECGDIVSTRMLGHWRLDQLTTLMPLAEVVEVNLRELEVKPDDPR